MLEDGMVWYGCGCGMVWVLVWVWAYDVLTAMVKCFLQVDSRLQKVTRIAPEFGGLVSGVPWWLVKYGKNPPRLKWWIFFGSQLLRCYWSLRRHLSTAHTCRAGSVWRELLFNGSRSITLWKFGEQDWSFLPHCAVGASGSTIRLFSTELSLWEEGIGLFHVLN